METFQKEIDQHLLKNYKIEHEGSDLTSSDSEEEDTSDFSTDEDFSGDLNYGTKMNEQMKRIRYQNELLLFRLEQIEDTEKRLKDKLQAMKEEASKEEILHVKKIAALESALKKKTELLINALKEKG
jgi:predicted RNase H-like nuclease (RuvC/YqgF family)